MKFIQARGETAIVLDSECEYVPEFFRPERGDLILNPLDVRCPGWAPWAELRPGSEALDAEALATALPPDPANPFSQSGADFFFRESARTLIVGLLNIVRTGDPADIPKLLGLPRPKLKEAFRGIAAEALIDPGAHAQGAGIVATAFKLNIYSTSSVEDVDTFLDAIAYNWLIAGTDAHAKNYALLIGAQSRIRLAPFYDIASILPYPEFENQRIKLSMKIGGEYRLRHPAAPVAEVGRRGSSRAGCAYTTSPRLQRSARRSGSPMFAIASFLQIDLPRSKRAIPMATVATMVSAIKPPLGFCGLLFSGLIPFSI